MPCVLSYIPVRFRYPACFPLKGELSRDGKCTGVLSIIRSLQTLTLLMIVVLPMTRAPGQSREDAVRAARDGHTDDAIRTLQTIVANNRSDTGAALDLAVILSWAKRPREATDVFERTPVTQIPEYVLLAMTRAYRDQQRFGIAQGLAHEGLRRFPEQKTWTLLNVLLEGDLASAAGDRFGALRAYATAQEIAPKEAGISAAMSSILMQLNAPYGAASLSTIPDPGIQAAQAAAMVRWGANFEPPEPARRFEETDAAIGRLEVLIRDAESMHPADRGLVFRLKRDRVLALRNRERWSDAVKAAEELREAGDSLPPYVREAEADSLLALRHPEEALRAYREVLAADPSNRNARQGLFYSQIETEDFHAAFATTEELTRGQEPGIRLRQLPRPVPNPDWLDAQVLGGQARYYANIDSDAWRQLKPLANGAPGAGYLRSALGSVAADRGWPRWADEEINIAAEIAPDDRGIQVAVADSDLRRKRFREARRRAEELNSLFPGDAAVQRLVRDIGMHDAMEIQFDTEAHHESGSAANRPGSDFNTNVRVYSSPFAERWRALGAFDYFSAKPEEGPVHRVRYGAGAEAEWSDFTLEAIAWNNAGALSRAGATLAGTWEPTDHWSFSGDGELYSSETPLRAVLHGITASGGSFQTSFTANESLATSGRVGAFSFSDGNQRVEGSLTFFRRVLDRPHLKLNIRPEVYASHNTRFDAPYFNPAHDASANLALELNHMIWRRYERNFRQSLTIGAGPYWEAHYRPDWLAQIRYQQTLELQSGFEIHYRVDLGRRVYDGLPVHDVGIVAGLNKRLSL